MKEYIFYYITENIATKERKVFPFNSYQGDVGNYIDYHNQLWAIVDWAVEPETLDDQF